MPNPLHLITEEDFLEESSKLQDKLDNVVLALHGIAAGQGGHGHHQGLRREQGH